MEDNAPELSVREGYKPPRDLPRGDCTLTCLDDTGRLRVDHADPRILISAELLAETFANGHPDVSLSLPPKNGFPGQGAYWEGALLKIDGINQTVIYHIREHVAAVNGYIAEWPD